MTAQKQNAILQKILCPFCSKPWNESMIEAYGHSGNCDTCDYGTGVEITIKCDGCKREIYSKDTR